MNRYHFLKNNGWRIITVTHLLFWTATNLISPFLSIFFMKKIPGLTISEIGISSMIFFLTFGATLPIIGMLSDRIQGLQDEIIFAAIGYFLRALGFALALIAGNIWSIYFIHMVLGLSRALSHSTDKVIYTNILSTEERKDSGFFWALDESLVNLTAAIGSGLGGYLAYAYSPQLVIFIAILMTISSGFTNLKLIYLTKSAKSE